MSIPPFEPGFFEEERFVVARDLFNMLWAKLGVAGSVTRSAGEQQTLAEVYPPLRLAMIVLMRGGVNGQHTLASEEQETSLYLRVLRQLLICKQWMHSQPSVSPYLKLKAHPFDLGMDYARSLLRMVFDQEAALGGRQGRLCADNVLRELLMLWKLLGLSLDERPTPGRRGEITRAIHALEKRLEESSLWEELETMPIL
ncbi:MAG: hypothetical protein Q9173_000495 [Seirophora scorigena]